MAINQINHSPGITHEETNMHARMFLSMTLL